jgi:hypothetical protein
MHLRHVALLVVAPALLLTHRASAQGGANADSARTRANTSAVSGEIMGSPNDPLRGNPNTYTPLAVQARRMQDAFERNHRGGLRFYNGGADARCEVEIGTMCYWNNNGDVPPPAERSDALIEREQLLELLGRAQNADATDDWVSGMRVRYAIEADRNSVAIEAARACMGTVWWCRALEGLALHVDNQHVAAASAFDKALSAMSTEQRCRWTDMTAWLDTVSQPAYRATSCKERESTNAYVLRMAQPLWTMPANDLRNELLARWTISRVHSLGRLPYDMGWIDAILQLQVRYGWPTAWSIQNGGVADPRPPSVTGHEPTPSYDFMPSPAALDDALKAKAADWEPARRKARMRYAPRYATGFGELPHQFARFRRGDSTIVAGAWRLVRELEMGRAPYNAGLVIDSAPGKNANPIIVRRDSAGANGALIANLGVSPKLASLEVVAPAGKRAARVRSTVEPLAASARLSDFLLLQRSDPSTTPSLERVAPTAFGSLTIDPGTTIGLFWEIYRDVSPANPVQVSIRAQRLNTSFMQRLTSSIGLSKAMQPVSIRYTDNGRADSGVGRSISVAFPEVPPGDYRLTLLVSGKGMTDSTSQVIRVRGDDR